MTNIQNDTNMGLFILIENGQPVNHPVTGSNLTMFFPDFDPENPPPPFEKFKRLPLPQFTQMEKHVGTTYEKIDGIWQDVYHIEPLSTDEKNQKLLEWQARTPKPYASWIIDEDNLKWTPPIPYPTDGNSYGWDETEQKWCEQITEPLQYNLITITDPSELPPNGPSQSNDFYILADGKGLIITYKWTGNEWIINKPEKIKLSDQIIISASLNDKPVRVMGVVTYTEDLDTNYNGEVADAYIVDHINQLAAWNGSTWEIVPVDNLT